MKNQDEDPPGNFNPERTQKMIEEWNHQKSPSSKDQ